MDQKVKATKLAGKKEPRIDTAQIAEGRTTRASEAFSPSQVTSSGPGELPRGGNVSSRLLSLKPTSTNDNLRSGRPVSQLHQLLFERPTRASARPFDRQNTLNENANIAGRPLQVQAGDSSKHHMIITSEMQEPEPDPHLTFPSVKGSQSKASSDHNDNDDVNVGDLQDDYLLNSGSLREANGAIIANELGDDESLPRVNMVQHAQPPRIVFMPAKNPHTMQGLIKRVHEPHFSSFKSQSSLFSGPSQPSMLQQQSDQSGPQLVPSPSFTHDQEGAIGSEVQRDAAQDIPSPVPYTQKLIFPDKIIIKEEALSPTVQLSSQLNTVLESENSSGTQKESMTIPTQTNERTESVHSRTVSKLKSRERRISSIKQLVQLKIERRNESVKFFDEKRLEFNKDDTRRLSRAFAPVKFGKMDARSPLAAPMRERQRSILKKSSNFDVLSPSATNSLKTRFNIPINKREVSFDSGPLSPSQDKSSGSIEKQPRKSQLRMAKSLVADHPLLVKPTLKKQQLPAKSNAPNSAVDARRIPLRKMQTQGPNQKLARQRSEMMQDPSGRRDSMQSHLKRRTEDKTESEITSMNSSFISSLGSEVYREEFGDGFEQFGRILRSQAKEVWARQNYCDDNQSIGSAYAEMERKGLFRQTSAVQSELESGSDQEEDGENSLFENSMQGYESDSSNEDMGRDIQFLFDEHITTQQITRIHRRQRAESQAEMFQSGTSQPSYDDYNNCAELLKRGIQVIKHNYTNRDYKRVDLWLSKNEATLYYRPVEPENRVLAFLRGARTINLSSVLGIIYGPFSMTFDMRKKKVIEALNFTSTNSRIDDKEESKKFLHSDDENDDQNDSQGGISAVADVQNLAYRRRTAWQQYQRKVFMESEEHEAELRRMATKQRLNNFIASDGMFYAWECVSLVMKNRTTVDLVVRDSYQMMCLLHVLRHKIFMPKKSFAQEPGCLRTYKFMKLKMKLSYIARSKEIDLADLLFNAIYRTVKDLRTLSVYKLQKIAALYASQDQLLGKTEKGQPMRKSQLQPIEEQKIQNFGEACAFAQNLDSSDSGSNPFGLEDESQKLSDSISKESQQSLQRPKENKLLLASNRAQNGDQFLQQQRERQESVRSLLGLYQTQRTGAMMKSGKAGADFSPSGREARAYQRVNQKFEKGLRLTKVIYRFIKLLDLQILHLQLLKEDQQNPWLELIKEMMRLGKTENTIAQSFKFYFVGSETKKMRQRHSQRVKLVLDYDSKSQTVKQLVQAQLLLNQVLFDRYDRPIKSRDKIRRRQISNVQGQVMQIYVLSNRILEINQLAMTDKEQDKKRKIAKKRANIQRCILEHIAQMQPMGRRLISMTKREAQYEFFKAMNNWRVALNQLEEVSNLKFDAHLRNFGDFFEQAKKRIRHMYLLKRELKKKASQYKKLFSLSKDQMVKCGFIPKKLNTHRLQFKQRNKTLSAAILELQQDFGIKLVDRKTRLRNNGQKGNDLDDEAEGNCLVAEEAFKEGKLLDFKLPDRAMMSMRASERKRKNLYESSRDPTGANKSKDENALRRKATQTRVILFNPDQSSQGDLDEQLNDISDEIDIDAELGQRRYSIQSI